MATTHTYKLNVPVSVLKNAALPERYDQEDWQVHSNTWAEFENLSDREQIEGEQVTEQVKQRVIVRFDDTIEPGMRLKVDEKHWEIMTAIDLGHEHQYNQLTVVECQTG